MGSASRSNWFLCNRQPFRRCPEANVNLGTSRASTRRHAPIGRHDRDRHWPNARHLVVGDSARTLVVVRNESFRRPTFENQISTIRVTGPDEGQEAGAVSPTSSPSTVTDARSTL